MNDQAWNNPDARGNAVGADNKDGLSWIDNTLNRAIATSQFSRALVQFDPDDRLEVLEDAHEFFAAGFPIPLLGSMMEQAQFWADRASRSERKAYLLACFNTISPEDQAAFLRHVRQHAGPA